MFISNSLWFSFTLERLLTYSLSKPLSTIIPSFYFWQTHISEIAYFAISKYDYENVLQNFPMFCIYFLRSEAIHRGNEPFLIFNLIACNNLNVQLPSFLQNTAATNQFCLSSFSYMEKCWILKFPLSPCKINFVLSFAYFLLFPHVVEEHIFHAANSE